VSVETQPLPVREKYSEAELAVFEQWLDEHGELQDWSEDVRHNYAATIAHLRSMGQI
jgi:hypothetical protein